MSRSRDSWYIKYDGRDLCVFMNRSMILSIFFIQPWPAWTNQHQLQVKNYHCQPSLSLLPPISFFVKNEITVLSNIAGYTPCQSNPIYKTNVVYNVFHSLLHPIIIIRTMHSRCDTLYCVLFWLHQAQPNFDFHLPSPATLPCMPSFRDPSHAHALYTIHTQFTSTATRLQHNWIHKNIGTFTCIHHAIQNRWATWIHHRVCCARLSMCAMLCVCVCMYAMPALVASLIRYSAPYHSHILYISVSPTRWWWEKEANRNENEVNRMGESTTFSTLYTTQCERILTKDNNVSIGQKGTALRNFRLNLKTDIPFRYIFIFPIYICSLSVRCSVWMLIFIFICWTFPQNTKPNTKTAEIKPKN